MLLRLVLALTVAKTVKPVADELLTVERLVSNFLEERHESEECSGIQHVRRPESGDGLRARSWE
jgi:hypothetical protein